MPLQVDDYLKLPNKLVKELNAIVGDVTVKVSGDLGEADYWSLYSADTRRDIASFQLEQFHGCCGVAIVTGLHVSNDAWCGLWGQKGLGMWMTKLAEYAAAMNGYTVLMATDVIDNQATQRIFSKRRFRRLHKFTNRRTDNSVGVYMKSLPRYDNANY